MIRRIKLLILLAGFCASCHTVPPPVVQVVTDCGAPALRDLALHLLDDVTSALLVTGSWQAALAAVAARAGVDGLAAVKCAVAEVLAKADKQLAFKALMDPAEAARTQLLRDRAATWMQENP